MNLGAKARTRAVYKLPLSGRDLPMEILGIWSEKIRVLRLGGKVEAYKRMKEVQRWPNILVAR